MAYAESPKGLSKWQQFQHTSKNFGLFIYNKEKGEVLGRNAASWGKITLFFVVFYLCLAAFFAAMLNAFLATMPDPKDGPKLTQYLAGYSALRTSPSHQIASFDPNKPNTYEEHLTSIRTFFKEYEEQTGKSKDDFLQEPCNFTSSDPRPSDKKKQCYFDLAKLGPCYDKSPNFTFGYEDGAPCFFMRMNRVFNWVPEPDSGLSYLKLVCDDAEVSTVYPKDTPGFPVSFFPYRGDSHWLAPIVAVKINATSSKQVKCNVHGKNIKKSTTYLLERGAYNRIRLQIE
ncbi:hypothetical protein QZH41_016707 [Actinostola sp. cb2023]|nr:hypothetical protein QZH41_016707 [Actinostola sp. cb2023]